MKHLTLLVRRLAWRNPCTTKSLLWPTNFTSKTDGRMGVTGNTGSAPRSCSGSRLLVQPATKGFNQTAHRRFARWTRGNTRLRGTSADRPIAKKFGSEPTCIPPRANHNDSRRGAVRRVNFIELAGGGVRNAATQSLALPMPCPVKILILRRHGLVSLSAPFCRTNGGCLFCSFFSSTSPTVTFWSNLGTSARTKALRRSVIMALQMCTSVFL
jgi:hypothetical protein